jgi:hypothetical protein
MFFAALMSRFSFFSFTFVAVAVATLGIVAFLAAFKLVFARTLVSALGFVFPHFSRPPPDSGYPSARPIDHFARAHKQAVVCQPLGSF